MASRPFSLNLAMKLIYISSHCQKDALCQCICLSSVQISPKIHVFFYISKRPFCLNTAIHPDYLLICLIQEQERYGKADAFWSIW